MVVSSSVIWIVTAVVTFCSSSENGESLRNINTCTATVVVRRRRCCSCGSRQLRLRLRLLLSLTRRQWRRISRRRREVAAAVLNRSRRRRGHLDQSPFYYSTHTTFRDPFIKVRKMALLGMYLLEREEELEFGGSPRAGARWAKHASLL